MCGGMRNGFQRSNSCTDLVIRRLAQLLLGPTKLTLKMDSAPSCQLERAVADLSSISDWETLLHRLAAHDPSLTVVQCHSGSTPEQIMQPGGGGGGGLFGGGVVEGIDLDDAGAEMLADVSLEWLAIGVSSVVCPCRHW